MIEFLLVPMHISDLITLANVIRSSLPTGILDLYGKTWPFVCSYEFGCVIFHVLVVELL